MSTPNPTSILDIYNELTTTEKGKTTQWVKKERLERLQSQFDAVCEGHSKFITLIHKAILNPPHLPTP